MFYFLLIGLIVFYLMIDVFLKWGVRLMIWMIDWNDRRVMRKSLKRVKKRVFRRIEEMEREARGFRD